MTALVFVHEMGHFLIARRNGVRVEIFSIGFGPEIFGWTDRAKTRWKFSLIPLGGYVKMFGDANVASQPSGEKAEMTPEEREVAFHTKRLSQRTWIVIGGPLANFVFAWVIFIGLFSTVGQQFTPPVVGDVIPDSAAEAAGILPDDRIVAINGSTIERFEEVQRMVQPRPDVPLEVTLLRDGERIVVNVVPRLVETVNNFGQRQKIGRLGITRRGIEYVQHGIAESFWRAGEETLFIAVSTLEAIGEIIIGARSADQLGGPVRIVQMSGMMAQAGVPAVLWFMAVLSISLGLINLFPIPLLDGGHLMFYALEALRGRPLGERAQEYGFRIGIAVVVSLMLFVTMNDLIQLGVFDFFKRLVT
ncbi:MAG: RIP metalloprotease RseP [Kiloniellales bacterium]